MKAVQNPSKLYTAQRRIRHIETHDFRLTEFQLAAGQHIPWHKHSTISDTFYVIGGAIRVSMMEPTEAVEVFSGQTYVVPPCRPHLVENAGIADASFLVLQGVGTFDFVPTR